jgi:hypothetical protein
MRASLATPEVRLVPTCSEDLSETAHRLLAHLTVTAKKRSNRPAEVKGDVEDWAVTLGLPSPSVRLAFDELQRDEEGDPWFVWPDKRRGGGWVVYVACTCPNVRSVAKGADSSIPPSGLAASRKEDSPQGSGGEASSTRSASMILPPPAVNPVIEDGEPLTPSPTCFGAMADEPDDPPRKTASARRNDAWSLAEYFADKVAVAASRQGYRVSRGTIRRGALAAHFKDLMAWGTPASDVRQVIDDFALDYRRYHKAGVDPGKVFLAHRRRLFADQEERATFITERDIDKFKANAAARGFRYATLDDLRRKPS